MTDHHRRRSFARRHRRAFVFTGVGAVVAVVALLTVPVDDLGPALAGYAAASWWCFVILYGTGAPWWRTALGRNYLALGLLIAAIVTWAALLLHGVDVPGQDGVRIALYGTLLILGIRHTYDFVAGQVRGRHQRLEVIAQHLNTTASKDR